MDIHVIRNNMDKFVGCFCRVLVIHLPTTYYRDGNKNGILCNNYNCLPYFSPISLSINVCIYVYNGPTASHYTIIKTRSEAGMFKSV